MSAQDLINHGLEVQGKSKQSLERTLRVVEEAKAIGRETVITLDQHTKQTEEMYDNLESTQTTLERSTSIIKRVARKVMTDKCIWVIAFVLIAVVLFIIIWKATR